MFSKIPVGCRICASITLRSHCGRANLYCGGRVRQLPPQRPPKSIYYKLPSLPRHDLVAPWPDWLPVEGETSDDSSASDESEAEDEAGLRITQDVHKLKRGVPARVSGSVIMEDAEHQAGSIPAGIPAVVPVREAKPVPNSPEVSSCTGVAGTSMVKVRCALGAILFWAFTAVICRSTGNS
jgi:hypothetical protein